MYPDAENVQAEARKWGDVPWYRIKTYAMKEDHLINENYKADCINVHPQCNNIHKTSSTLSLTESNSPIILLDMIISQPVFELLAFLESPSNVYNIRVRGMWLWKGLTKGLEYVERAGEPWQATP